MNKEKEEKCVCGSMSNRELAVNLARVTGKPVMVQQCPLMREKEPMSRRMKILWFLLISWLIYLFIVNNRILGVLDFG